VFSQKLIVTERNNQGRFIVIDPLLPEQKEESISLVSRTSTMMHVSSIPSGCLYVSDIHKTITFFGDTFDCLSSISLQDGAIQSLMGSLCVYPSSQVIYVGDLQRHDVVAFDMQGQVTARFGNTAG